MAGAKNEFTNVTRLNPEAIGEPGKRTFRVLVESGSSSATIWLEKEQLFQLALAMQQLFVSLSKQRDTPGTPPVEREAKGLPSLDFKASKLALGHDANRGMFIIDAHDLEDEDEDTPIVRVWASREQVEKFAEEALRACASGRPLCPLCGRPIDPDGHGCPRVNGYAKALDLRE